MSHRLLRVIVVATVATVSLAAQGQPVAPPPTSVEKSAKPLLIGWIDHQAEHYGKLVSNYRAIGIVPPISRKPSQ